MTVFTIPATDWRFALVMVLVCVPFMLLITFLQTRSFGILLRKLGAIGNAIARLFNRVRRRPLDTTETPDNRPTTAAASCRSSVTMLLRNLTSPRGEREGDLEEGKAEGN